VVKHTSRDDDPQRSLCGRNMVPGFTVGNAANCKLCEAIESKRQRTAELTRETCIQHAARLTEETGVTHRWDAADGRIVREEETPVPSRRSYGRLSGATSVAGVEVFHYETESWRVVIEFDSLEEAMAWYSQGDMGVRLIDACLATDRCFTIGEDRLIDYAGNVIAPVPAQQSNPHYACDTHGATCPTGEHVSHTVGNPYPGCDRCAGGELAARWGIDLDSGECPICDEVFLTRTAFAEHLLTEDQPETPVPSPMFQVQGRRGGGWYNVPDEAYTRVGLAVRRVDTLADLVEDSEFRVLNMATGEVAYQRLKRAVPSPVGWPGASMVSGRADYAREPKRYRRFKGTRRNRRQCRGGWGK